MLKYNKSIIVFYIHFHADLLTTCNDDDPGSEHNNSLPACLSILVIYLSCRYDNMKETLFFDTIQIHLSTSAAMSTDCARQTKIVGLMRLRP